MWRREVNGPGMERAHSRYPLTWLRVAQRTWRKLPHLSEGLSVCPGLFVLVFVSLAQGCSGQGSQFRVTVLSHVLLCGRLTEGAGYYAREPVASSPQLEQIKSHQLR
ncbi:unnamed protein product [Pipistrellus nathusii]|uniref:Uncharacterized protein n=1 Tax=Pipistrellus nathusii TaxID=59473 RepID=A0ABP0ACF7_PIPNA